MSPISRRRFLNALAAVPLAPHVMRRAPAVTSRRSTDIGIREIHHGYAEFLYRTPYKFGGHEVDRVTLLNVNCTVETLGGRVAHGFGSMPLGNVWSFPSPRLTYDQTLAAMKSLAGRIRALTADYRESGHPIDINVALEPEYLKAAADVARAQHLGEPIPKLCTLVTASPFDAALHDAFGKVHNLNCYSTYGPEFLARDLSAYLGPEYLGHYPAEYVARLPKPRLALYHSVGASDPIFAADVKHPLHDGLPQTLPEWIRYNGLSHFKIKLNGDDLAWDVERVLSIHRAVEGTAASSPKRAAEPQYSLDFNERCPNVEYLLEFLRRLSDRALLAFRRIQYIEQPTARDLKANRANVMFAAAKLRPVVIDESLTDVESLLLAREMGYNGVALKACKGQSQVLLMTAVARRHGMFLCVQDLTCPGASLVHSATLAAHTPEVTTIEANSREYVPAANRGWESRFPGIFIIRDGYLRTADLTGPGLGVVP
jgi:L-alanine-DL-glutamate epimerase-like enolase superfamily enzyme